MGNVHVNKASRLYRYAARTWMIELVEKLNGLRFCQAKMGTGSNILSSRASLLPVNLQDTRRLEDWVGKGSGAVNRGGRTAKASQPANGGGGSAPRTAPRRPGGSAACSADHRPCARIRTSRQTCAPGSSRWVHLASATCATQCCQTIVHRPGS